MYIKVLGDEMLIEVYTQLFYIKCAQWATLTTYKLS